MIERIFAFRIKQATGNSGYRNGRQQKHGSSGPPEKASGPPANELNECCQGADDDRRHQHGRVVEQEAGDLIGHDRYVR